MIAEALEGNTDGIRIGGERIPADRYRDDQEMISSINTGLQRIMDRLVEVGKRYDMKINTGKTKAMRISKMPNRKVNITVERVNLKQVKEFYYLGSIITEDGRSEKEIKCRIDMAKGKFKDNKMILTNSIRTETKHKLIKSLI